MKAPRSVMKVLHQDLSGDLDRIKKRFAVPVKIALVVIVDNDAKRSVYLTDDTTENVINVIQRLERRADHVFTPEESYG